MADRRNPRPAGREPQFLLVPDQSLQESPEWMKVWETDLMHCSRVELGQWHNPHRNTWVNKLNLALYKADGPVVLCTQGLGCLAVAWWAEYEQPTFGAPVVGAIFVSPPDVDRPGSDARLARFGACPRETLPFPSYLVVEPDLPTPARVSAIRLARDWGSYFIDDSGWRQGGSDPRRWAPDLALLHSLEHRASAEAAQAH